MKRLFDIVFSFIGLIILSPLFAIVAVLIKFSSKGSVFFRQERIGKNFKPFKIYKFRTMVVDKSKKGPLLTVGGDGRITKVGRILRRLKIDELPQFFNVLVGDMSFVGPRPEVEKYVNKHKDDYDEILKIRPGITDMASLTYNNEEEVLKDKKDPEEYYIHILLPEKIRLAKEYIRKASLKHDIKMILLTIFKLFYPYDTARKIISYLTPYRMPIVIGIQFVIFGVANYLAFFIRFDGYIPYTDFYLFITYLPLILILRIIFLYFFSLDKGLWRYASVRDLVDIMAATSSGTILLLVIIRYILGDTAYPRSIYLLDWLLNVFLLGGVRMLRRLHEKGSIKQATKTRVIVIGAGDAAEMLIRDIEHSSLYLYEIIGLIDDNPRKKGLKIRNVPVIGSRKDLKIIVEREQPDEFVIAIPAASRSVFEEIVEDLRQYGLPIKSLPSLWSILSGRNSLSNIKVIKPEDVLFRAPVYDETTEVKYFLDGKRVMITGAGGSIGSELSRQVASYNLKQLILFERHEESLYKIDMELRSASQLRSTSQLHSIIGDILDEKRVNEVMEKFHPEIIFHAAAYKHVPLMEDNPYEAFRTNVIGTKIMAEKAREFGIERFVLISTDKAVNPINVMGMTKKIAEEIVQYLAGDMKIKKWGNDQKNNSTKYLTVRFGNVLESSGSVVPLFKEQIKRGGPVTITHPEITRYFMTIPEAVSLVLQAAFMGNGRDVFILDMGEPVKIMDLAKRMISLYGYKPGVDIDITFTGLRPGEKLYEELFNGDEKIEKTSHPKIYRAISNGRVNRNALEALMSLNDVEVFRDSSNIKYAINMLI